MKNLSLLSTLVCVCIQGVSRLVDITAGGDFLGLCDQKRPYKHVSDFGRLRSYGHFLIPVHAFVWTARTDQLAGDVLKLVAYRLRCMHYFCHLTRSRNYRQSIFLISTLERYLRNVGKMGCVVIRLASVYCMIRLLPRVQKPLSVYSIVTVPAPDVQNSKAIVT